MPLMLELNLVPLVAAHICAHGQTLKPDDLNAGLHFIARVCETEAVCDQPRDYLPSELKAELKETFEPVLRDLPPEDRRSLRPLLDAIQGQGPFRY